MTSELMHGEEETLNGDSGYLGAEKRKEAKVRNKSGKKIRYEINRRPSQMRKLNKSGQYQSFTPIAEKFLKQIRISFSAD